MINDIVRRLMPTICREERDYHQLVRQQYRTLLYKYPYADRPHLKRLAEKLAERNYEVKS